MDTKRLITTMAITLALVFGYQAFYAYLFKLHPEWKRPGQDTAQTTDSTPASTTQPSAATVVTTQPAVASSATAPAAAALPPGALRIVAATRPTRAELGSARDKDPTYALGVTVDSVGASIDQVTLNEFKRSVTHGRPVDAYVYQEPYPGAEETTHALATRAVIVNGARIDLDGIPWQLLEQNNSMARFAVDIADAKGPVLHVVKSYTVLDRQSTKDTSEGYELGVAYDFQNLSASPVTVQTVFNGPTTPPKEIERGADRSVFAGYDDDGQLVVARNMIEEFTPSRPTRDLTKSDKNQSALWAGAGSVYFEAVVRPVPTVGKSAIRLEKITAETINPSAQPDDRHVALTFQTPEIKLAPSQASALQLLVFLGPKKRDLLRSPYYTAFPLSYDRTLVVASGMCAICTFQPLINFLVSMLWLFHLVFRDWGLAIICLVLVVRACLHPITKRSQISMLKMGKMGPEMERLKKKYGDNKDELNKAMMEVYKTQGFTPILGCLPMFLQMPIWIALWSCLQSTFELRQEPFLYGMTWIHDLAKPDALYTFASPIVIPFVGWHLASINVLPMLVAVITFFNQKYMPRPAAATPEQEQQQKMMQWMSLLFPLMFYALPSGLNLYYVTSMGLGMLESKIIRDHIKEREAAEKAGRVLVDAKLTRAGKQAQRDKDDNPPKAPATGFMAKIMNYVAELQAKAEQVKRDQDRRGRDRA